jgi:protoheme IX farnesyltransferase
MKATVSSVQNTAVSGKGWVSVYADLVKARLTLLVLLTTLVGFYVGWQGPMNFALMLHALFGTALLASGAAALNQFLEREYDARMRRTASRPLPSGRLQPVTVILFGGFCSLAGLIYLSLLVNQLTAVLGAVSLVCYLFIYTPLKRVTWLNTAVGAIPGALPPLMGWAAARGNLEGGGWALFAMLAFWQMPHFFAIAWIYREEYAKAGFVMLPAVDPDGSRTGHQSVSHTLALLMVSLCPFLFQLAGPFYLAAAVLLGAGYLACAIQFARRLDLAAARRLFFASIIYLPLILIALVLDCTK